MSILAAIHAARESLGGIPVPNYDPEPVFSSGGCPDELAPSYVRAYAAAYRKANAEADAAEEARNAEAGRDLSPAEFRELVSAECPGLHLLGPLPREHE
jgi:hypothetical protein